MTEDNAQSDNATPQTPDSTPAPNERRFEPSSKRLPRMVREPGRASARARVEHYDKTPFQRWVNPALERKGWTLQLLADHAGMNNATLWKSARGSDGKRHRRPSYENAIKIGELLGDVEGCLISCGYPLPEKPGEVNDEEKFLTLFRLSSAAKRQAVLAVLGIEEYNKDDEADLEPTPALSEQETEGQA